ncbi:MAG: oligosaccharide flippase family protein, partial [Deltaproteobacteria bacterium]|nr:oligosaccharide flippase family protein [Deltaproteobacteria bacterium]
MKLSERVVIVLIGKLLSAAFSFGTSVVLARMLTRASFGTYQQAVLVVAYVTPLALFGIDQSVTFFIPRLRGNREIKSFVYQTTAILFLLGIAVSILLLFSAGWIGRIFHNSHLKSALTVFGFYPIFGFPFAIVSLVLYSLDRHKLSASLEAIFSCAQFLVITGLVWFNSDLTLVLLGLVVVACGRILASILLLRRCLGKEEGWTFNGSLLRDQLRFSAPLGFSKVLPIVTVNLDKIIISGFYAVSHFAIYAVGAIELPFVSLITYTTGNVISPRLSRLFYEGRKEELVLTWHRMVHKTSL